MLIYHGDNQSASRAALLSRKSADVTHDLHPVNFVGSQLLMSDLVNVGQTSTLFGQQNLIIIEDFFTGKKPGKEKEQIIKYLLADTSRNILIWESKNASLQLKSFPASTITKFDLPKHLFNYLETFSPGDLHQTLKDSEPQVVFFLLVKHLQNLLAASTGDISNLPAWKAAKLKSQAGGFTTAQLLLLHKQLVHIDYRQKNSLSPYDLSSALELWSVKAVN